MRLDLDFAKRLEFAEAATNRACVEARPTEQAAAWMQRAGATALFDGVHSPLTQTFGLGLESTPDVGDLEILEEFFQTRGAPVYHEVSPLADPALLDLLQGRGYRVCELTNLLWLDLADHEARPQPVRRIEAGEADQWAALSAAGWVGDHPELSEFFHSMGQMLSRCSLSHCFYAEEAGRPISTASLFVVGEMAVLAGASTPPEFRRRGGQSALLQARLTFAQERGCKLAMMGAQPGSRSQTNAQAAGFRVAYTRLKWVLSQSANARA